MELTGLEDLPDPSAQAPNPWHFAIVAILSLMAALALALWLVEILIQDRRDQRIFQVQERLAIEANGKVETLGAWLDGLAAQGNRIVRSDLIALFATETAFAEDDLELRAALAEQRPYMRSVMNELAKSHNLAGAYLMQPDGKVILQDRDALRMDHDPTDGIKRALASAKKRAFTLRKRADRTFIDIYLAMQASTLITPQADAHAVLKMTADAQPFLQNWLQLGGGWRQGEALVLEFAQDGQWNQLSAAEGVWDRQAVSQPMVFGFQFSGETGFRQTVEASETGWVLRHTAEPQTVFAPIDDFANTARFLAIAMALATAAGLTAMFWRQTARHHKVVAGQFEELARHIHGQAAILGGMMNATRDAVCLQDQHGELIFANPSFDSMDRELFLGHTSDSGTALIGQLTGTKSSDDDVVMVLLDGKERWFHVEHQSIELRKGKSYRLTIARDMSDVIARQQERDQLHEQTITTLARATELVDPYLEGHAVRVETLALRLAEQIDLDASQRTTLRWAAALSQFGKIFVPASILSKRGRHSHAEEAIMRTHVEHAISVLSPIEFGHPVVEAIAKVHERLDGSGYPKGLVAEDIPLPARILGIADVFCARTWPRSYRSAKSQNAICAILEEQARRYDPYIVQALRKLIDEGALEDLKPTVSKRQPHLVEAPKTGKANTIFHELISE